jgi:hypothetical protein
MQMILPNEAQIITMKQVLSFKNSRQKKTPSGYRLTMFWLIQLIKAPK